MADKIRATFTIETDYETLQELRQRFADDQVREQLRRHLHQVIATEVGAGVKIETELKTPAYRRLRKGPRAPLPQLKKGVLTWYDPQAQITRTVGKVGSRAWLDWLKDTRNKSFAFTSKPGATCTVIKNEQGYWIAHKRLGGKRRRKYLGKAESLTVKKMDQVAFELAQRTLV